MTKHKTLGSAIQIARRNKLKGLRQFAREIGVTASHVCHIEFNRRTPSEELLRVIATNLGLEIDELMLMAGRLSTTAKRYLIRVPKSMELVEHIATHNLGNNAIQSLLDHVNSFEETKEHRTCRLNKKRRLK